jgi:hypothetical protein
MKICPRCQKTYTDDNLNFCLEDGAVLTQSGASPMPETVVLSQPQMTQPQQPIATSQPGAQQSWNAPVQPSYSMQPPRKSSKTWIWVVGILGLVVVLCGGGLVGFFIWAANQTDTANTSYNKGASPTPVGNKSTTTTSTRTDVTPLDLSKWVQDSQAYGNTAFTDGEFIMSSTQKGHYFVIAGSKTQTSVKSDVKVTVRNITGADSTSGYGIVFHSNTTPLEQGYAFLINTATLKYRVVHHSPKNEGVVVAWTKSDAIKSGSLENTLEVHDLSDKIELYINGEMVKSIKNDYGYPNGVVGLYVSDAIRIAFKDLEIRK